MKTAGRLVFLMLVALLTGCATFKKPAQPVFFPPAPETPRIQFLTSYASSGDIIPPPSPLYTFITGVQPKFDPILKPYGIALHDSKLYVCDTVLNVLEVLDLPNRTFEYSIPSGPGRFAKPLNIRFDADGTRYVTDALKNCVFIYSATGKFLSALQAEGPDDTFNPTDVAISEDRIYVSDIGGRVVRVYDKFTRKPLFVIPKEKTPPEVQLSQPVNLAINKDGDIYVSDIFAFHIQVYDKDGTFLRTIGRHGDAPGEFARNKGIALDRENRLYAVDAVNAVVQIFDHKDQLLLYFGHPGGAAIQLELPAQVIIDYEHVDLFKEYVASGYELEYLIIVTSQYGPRKVSVFGFLKTIQRPWENEASSNTGEQEFLEAEKRVLDSLEPAAEQEFMEAEKRALNSLDPIMEDNPLEAEPRNAAD